MAVGVPVADAGQTVAAVRITRTFDSPREEVFRAWTEPERFRQWFGPPGGSTPSAQMDVRSGGSYRIEFRTPVRWTCYLVGTYLEVLSPERLIYTLGWERPLPAVGVADSRVTVEFRDRGGATEVTILHERLDTRRTRAFHRFGWNRSLRKLPGLLSRGVSVALVAVVWLAGLAAAPLEPARGAAGASAASKPKRKIVDRRVAFEVVNTNTSGVACPSDGRQYTVRGHLVAPRAALDDRDPVVTLYLHGINVGGVTNWHFSTNRLRRPRRYDYAHKLAKLGHASVVVDRLGYGSSDLPDGFQSCIGSAADVAHQIISQLRSGDYSVRRGRPVTFSKLVLAGHDTGGTTAQVEAYSYDDIDGLIVMDYADTGATPTAAQWSAEASAVCAQGGKEAREGGPSGYFDLGPSEEELALLAFPNSKPRLVEEIFRLRSRNPCGELASVPPAAAVNSARLGEVEVPVLIAAGDTDVAFSEDGVRRQRDLFTGSDDVTVEIFENTGHFPMFDRNAPLFRRTVAQWLRSREFASGSARGGGEAERQGGLPGVPDLPELPELPGVLPDTPELPELPDVLPELPDLPAGVLPEAPEVPRDDLPDAPDASDVVPELPGIDLGD